MNDFVVKSQLESFNSFFRNCHIQIKRDFGYISEGKVRYKLNHKPKFKTQIVWYSQNIRHFDEVNVTS